MRRERYVGEQKDGVRYTSVLREIEELDYAGCILDSSLNYDSYLDQTVLIFYYVVSSFTRIYVYYLSSTEIYELVLLQTIVYFQHNNGITQILCQCTDRVGKLVSNELAFEQLSTANFFQSVDSQEAPQQQHGGSCCLPLPHHRSRRPLMISDLNHRARWREPAHRLACWYRI